LRYLLLHGFTGTPEAFAPLGAERGKAPVLSGHLGSAASGGFWDEVDRLAEASGDCEGLLGYSLGGRLALGLLARFPSRFSHALIISAHPGLSDAAERAERRRGDENWAAELRQHGLERFVDAWEKLPLWASQAALPPGVLQDQRAQRLRHSAEGLAQSLLAHGLGCMPDLKPDLAHVVTPVDLLVGERDQKFVDLARDLLTVLPRARLTIAPRCGHNVLLERPDIVSALLRTREPP
jgi:2-succinyl-6-hydroxy-2,4-cyclohexadiene-1-carboxylate synthase